MSPRAPRAARLCPRRSGGYGRWHAVPAGSRRGPSSGPRWTSALFGLLGAIVLVTGLACQRTDGPERVAGVVVAVEARSIARADGLTLRAAGGQDYHFRVDPSVDWTPGHLREHMALGEPIVVEFTRQPDGLLATRIDDG